MSAAKETLDGASGLIGEEEEQIDESKLSWRERRKLNKQRKAEAKKRKAAEKDGVIWMDGKNVDWRDANVHVLTHSLHYGVGVFEGIRAYETSSGTAIFRLDDHVKRLFQSAHILGMKIPFSFETIRDACVNSVKDNNLDSAYIRPIAYYGSEGMGLHASDLSVPVSIASWFWGAYLGDEGLSKGVDICLSPFEKEVKIVSYGRKNEAE